MRRISFALMAVVIAVLALPGAADACAVCFQAKSDATRIAFIASTAAMTALPLLMVAGLSWWVWRRFARAAADTAAPGSSH